MTLRRRTAIGLLKTTNARAAPMAPVWLNACLPGKSLVVYEPGLRLVTDLVLREDAYTQERALLTQLLASCLTRGEFARDGGQAMSVRA
jgi:hypothetical protein